MTTLGYLVNKSGNRRALDYLITNLTLPVRTQTQDSFLQRDDLLDTTAGRKLNKNAVGGLALSDHPKAAEALRSIRNSLKSGAEKEMIDEALATLRKIADKGLAEYYRRSQL